MKSQRMNNVTSGKLDSSQNLLQVPLQIRQLSFTNLIKAFREERQGKADRAALFAQLHEEFPSERSKPQLWFCSIGLNDFAHLEPSAVCYNPQDILDQFIYFFGKIRAFSPHSLIFWLGMGNVWRSHRSFQAMTQFKQYMDAACLPWWLQVRNLSFDCTDTQIKDHTGHWQDDYIRLVSTRFMDQITRSAKLRFDAVGSARAIVDTGAQCSVVNGKIRHK